MEHVIAGDSVYVGIANPKGEHFLKDTTYLDEVQLESLVEHLPGLPVRIEHFTALKDGTPIPPCGEVIKGRIDPHTKKLYVAFKLANNPIGSVAKRLLGEHTVTKGDGKHEYVQIATLGELSLGYNIHMEKMPDGTSKAVGHQVTELSICRTGARPGTIIIGRAINRTEFNTKRPRELPTTPYTTTEYYRKIDAIQNYRKKRNGG